MKKCLLLLLAVLMLSGCAKSQEKEFYVPVRPPMEEAPTEIVEHPEATEPVEEVDLSISEPELVELYYDPDADDMMNVRDVIANIPVELKYATEDNLAKAPIYNFQEAYLRYGTIQKLIEVQQELWEQGYSLKIWDAFRPKWAQVHLWKQVSDPEFVSDPYKGELPHCRGNTVDVTLVNGEGREVEMPTGFDCFTEEADRDYSDVSEDAARNAKLLEEVMVNHGFVPYAGEWWHFTDEDQYDVDEEFTPGAPMLWTPNCKEYISLRAKPDVRSTAVERIYKGAAVTLLGWEDTFAKVDYEGTVGYVLANYIMPMDEGNFIDQLYDIQLTETYSYDDVMFDIEWLMEEFPELVEMEIIGQSSQGVDIPVIRVGNPEAEHNVLIHASIHGREHATGWMMMALLSRALARDDAYLQDVCFHVIPMANPDGVAISQNETLDDTQNVIYQQDKALKYTKEKKSMYASHWKANYQGVDLNRNFPAGWENLKNRNYPSFQWFGGNQPFTTSETKALRDYTQAHTFEATVSMHASGCLVYYGFGDKQPANKDSQSLAKALCDMNGYTAMGTSSTDGGGYKDWAIDSLGIPSVTMEIGATIVNDGSDPVPLQERDLYGTFARNIRMLEVLANWVMEQNPSK